MSIFRLARRLTTDIGAGAGAPDRQLFPTLFRPL